jgi:hypothetical protein
MRSFFTVALLCAVTAGVAAMGCGKKDSSSGDTAGSSGSSGSGGSVGSVGSGGSGASCEGTLNPNECGKCAEIKCCPEVLDCAHNEGCNQCLSDPMADQTVCAMNAQVTALGMCLQTTCTEECKPPVLKCARYCCDNTDCGTGTCTLGEVPGFAKLGVCRDAAKAVACDAPAMSMTMGSCFTKDATNVCNPVTNDGCDSAAGAACDLENNSQAFTCFPSGNEQVLCGECNNQAGPFCQATFRCSEE